MMPHGLPPSRSPGSRLATSPATVTGTPGVLQALIERQPDVQAEDIHYLAHPARRDRPAAVHAVGGSLVAGPGEITNTSGITEGGGGQVGDHLGHATLPKGWVLTARSGSRAPGVMMSYGAVAVHRGCWRGGRGCAWACSVSGARRWPRRWRCSGRRGWLRSPRRCLRRFRPRRWTDAVCPVGGGAATRRRGRGHPFYSAARFLTRGQTLTLLAPVGLRLQAARSALYQVPGGEPAPEPARDGETPAAGFVCWRTVFRSVLAHR